MSFEFCSDETPLRTDDTRFALGSLLDGGEPIEQVPDSLRMAGYDIEQIKDCGEFFEVQVRCPLTPKSVQ